MSVVLLVRTFMIGTFVENDYILLNRLDNFLIDLIHFLQFSVALLKLTRFDFVLLRFDLLTNRIASFVFVQCLAIYSLHCNRLISRSWTIFGCLTFALLTFPLLTTFALFATSSLDNICPYWNLPFYKTFSFYNICPSQHFPFFNICPSSTFALVNICLSATFALLQHLPFCNVCPSVAFALLQHLPNMQNLAKIRPYGFNCASSGICCRKANVNKGKCWPG